MVKKRVHTVCPQGITAQVFFRLHPDVTAHVRQVPPPSVSSTNPSTPIGIQHSRIRITSDRDAPPSVSSRIHWNPYLNPYVDPMSTQCRPNVDPKPTRCRPEADPMPTQCRPWRHKLIKFAFSGELWKGQNDMRFSPFETKIGSLKSISRDLSNGTL